MIAEMWQQVLGISEIGINDDFFELGGDSLLTIQIISRVRQSFNIEPKVRDIFEASTVARFAEMVDHFKKDCGRIGAPEIRPVSREVYRVDMSSRGGLSLPEALKRKA
jgi:acyl carrier protein